MIISPPFVAVEKNGDIHVFRDSTALASGLEAVDVRNGEFRIFDKNGATVTPSTEIVVVKSRPWYLGGDTRCEMVLLRPTAESPDNGDLAAALNKALDLLPDSPTARPSSLSALLDLAISKFGYS